jgi:hypothetical protein
MKLIDEKGRLFGKINIIDLVVVLLILFLVAAVGYKVLGPNVETSPNAQGEITAVVKFTFKTDGVVSSLQKGQKLVFGTDYIPGAVIEEVNAVEADYVTTDDQGKVHVEKHPFLKDIYVTIKANVDINAPILKVGTQEICQGKNFVLKTQTTDITGSVETITINK